MGEALSVIAGGASLRGAGVTDQPNRLAPSKAPRSGMDE
jgi:hypothetical protein